MPHPFDLPQRLCLTPAFDARERAVLAGFATGAVRRVWPGQPGARSPWTVCADGCCLMLSDRVGPDTAALWLRFLLRELVAPRSEAARRRAEAAGLVPHRVDGRVLVARDQGEPGEAGEPRGAAGAGPPRLIRVADSRVRELALDDELVALDERRRPAGRAEVVDLGRHRVGEEPD
ncbi:hypothetical protein [Nocardioides sp. zg-DK7169]|uniref:hypothetical protein n=1 Tax=Nocardioides sp. zg-DK7169 TaxID=2736600 RepID=UPI001556F651|nr:hypothetical protein [Nocardioides sp. zg-DK7169]NPC97461.1 hypothetical protein [Nocardioides sp. zg-DK7169]